jgi:hypothetical protein
MCWNKATFLLPLLAALLFTAPLMSQDQPNDQIADPAAAAAADQVRTADAGQEKTPGVASGDDASARTAEKTVREQQGLPVQQPAQVRSPEPRAETRQGGSQRSVAVEPAKEVSRPAAAPSASMGLLELKDDSLKFSRIPGIQPAPKIAAPQALETAAAESVAENSEVADEDGEGLLGMSRERGDTVTRIALVLLIVVIVVLYRIRSKGGGRRVVRSYPKR